MDPVIEGLWRLHLGGMLSWADMEGPRRAFLVGQYYSWRSTIYVALKVIYGEDFKRAAHLRRNIAAREAYTAEVVQKAAYFTHWDRSELDEIERRHAN
jgi:hypothetical protein